jgi:peptide/nickel transport system permease protein
MGLVSGYFGGWVDHLIMRITDILLAFPYLLLVIAIVSMLGPSLMNAIIAIGVRMIPEFARLVRSVVLSIRSKEYVLATRAVGASNLRIIFHHVLPNSTAPMIVQSTLLMAGAILAESTLSFLGLGTQPPDPSWGTMVSRGREYLITYPHLSLFPGLAIVIVVYALNVFGDWVRDVLDPHTEWTKPPQV